MTRLLLTRRRAHEERGATDPILIIAGAILDGTGIPASWVPAAMARVNGM